MRRGSECIIQRRNVGKRIATATDIRCSTILSGIQKSILNNRTPLFVVVHTPLVKPIFQERPRFPDWVPTTYPICIPASIGTKGKIKIKIKRVTVVASDDPKEVLSDASRKGNECSSSFLGTPKTPSFCPSREACPRSSPNREPVSGHFLIGNPRLSTQAQSHHRLPFSSFTRFPLPLRAFCTPCILFALHESERREDRKEHVSPKYHVLILQHGKIGACLVANTVRAVSCKEPA